MKNFGKNKILAMFGLIVVVLVAGCASQGSAEGRAVFGITDAAADMGTVTSVRMTVDSVKVHSAAQGWVTVSSTPRTYDLLQLKAEGQTALLADATLDAGTYDQMQLDVSNVVVVDTNGTHTAKLPSSQFKIIGNMVVNANSTATATFDFIADESLHVTGNGQYILAPVVQVETRQNASASVQGNNRVQVSGGSVVTNVRVGMDVNGNVGVGLNIPANVNVSIVGGGIVVGSGLGVGAGAGGSLVTNSSGGIGIGIGSNASAKIQSGQTVTLYGGETAEVTQNGVVYNAKFVSSADSDTAIVMVGSAQASVNEGSSETIGGLRVFVENVYDFSGTENDYARIRFGSATSSSNVTGNATY